MSSPEPLALNPDLPSRSDRIWSHRNRPDVLGVVAFGGAVGTVARYELGLAVTTADHLPLGILIINTAGCFLLGVLGVLLAQRVQRPGPARRYLRPLLATGFTGGFTTMSTFVVGADLLVRDHRTLTAVVYVVVTFVAGLAGTMAGLAVARTHRMAGRS